MTKPSFVYVTFIATTCEKVWQALVDGDITRRYWFGPFQLPEGLEHRSDWQPGSRWESRRADAERSVAMVGKVISSAPPSRLVLTWTRPNDEGDEARQSLVTFQIED